MTDAMEAEFDLVAEWTRQAVRQLGEDYALPAACQGSASPAALDWLAHACRVAAGTRLLDVGGGTGGPAAYAARRFERASAAGRSDAGRLPHGARALRSARRRRCGRGAADRDRRAPGRLVPRRALHDAAVAPRCCAELRRVLADDGELGLLVFERHAARLPDTPEGNDFPTAAELDRQLRAAGFVIVDRVAVRGAGARAARRGASGPTGCRPLIAAEHGTDPRYRMAQDQQQRIAELLADGAIGGELVHARPADRS